VILLRVHSVLRVKISLITEDAENGEKLGKLKLELTTGRPV
jgi:hypothetical protein